MLTCCICGTGYKHRDDRVIYGCTRCQKGFSANQEATEDLKQGKSPYVSEGLRYRLYKEYGVQHSELEFIKEKELCK